MDYQKTEARVRIQHQPEPIAASDGDSAETDAAVGDTKDIEIAFLVRKISVPGKPLRKGEYYGIKNHQAKWKPCI